MKVILINFSLFLFLLLLSEGAVRLINPKMNYTFIPPNSYSEEKILAARKADQIPYYQLGPGVHEMPDITSFTIDSKKRRLVPDSKQLLNNEEVLFFGCSYAFGFNNKDNETLPYFFQELSKNKVFNYGVMGGSPIQTYQIIKKKKDAFSDLTSKNPTAIYIFFTDQINRANNSPSYLFWGPLSTPYYTLKKGELSGGGFLLHEKPLLFWSYYVLRSSKFLQFIVSLSPPKANKVNSEDLKLPLKLISESAKLFKEKYPEGRFLVYLYNGDSTIREAMENEGLKLLNKETFLDQFGQNPLYFQKDHHLSPLGNQTMAKDIFNALKRL